MKKLIQTLTEVGNYLTSDVEESDTADVVCDAQAMPFNDGRFDLVIAFEVMEHIPDTDAFISETARVLSDGGEVLISVPFMYGRHDFQDFHRWTELGLRQVFGRHGLSVETVCRRGGTALAMNRLAVNFVHDRMGVARSGWRSRSWGKKLYFGLMTLLLVPVTVLSWFALLSDQIFDRNSANPLGFVLIAKKVPQEQ